MHAYLIYGKNKDKIHKIAEEMIGKQGFAKNLQEIKKIEDIRRLGNFLSLKISDKTAVVIEDIDKASEEAQNAFLKLLEEPQETVSFILTAASSEGVLPTIESRCAMINAEGGSHTDAQAVKQAGEFIGLKREEKLIKIGEIKGREEALAWLGEFIAGAKEIMLEKPDVYKSLEGALVAYRRISANGNVQLQLTNFVIHY